MEEGDQFAPFCQVSLSFKINEYDKSQFVEEGESV